MLRVTNHSRVMSSTHCQSFWSCPSATFTDITEWEWAESEQNHYEVLVLSQSIYVELLDNAAGYSRMDYITAHYGALYYESVIHTSLRYIEVYL